MCLYFDIWFIKEGHWQDCSRVLWLWPLPAAGSSSGGSAWFARELVGFLFSFLELCPSYYEFFREMKCSSSLKKSWTLSSSKRALESVYKLSPLVAVRKPVDSIMGFWRGRDGLCVLFDVANTEPSGRSGKRMFCSLGKEKINLKSELKLRNSAGLRCTRDEFAYFNGNIFCLVAEAGKCFCKDLVGEVMCVCVCVYREIKATARARVGDSWKHSNSLKISFWLFGCSSESERLVTVVRESLEIICGQCFSRDFWKKGLLLHFLFLTSASIYIHEEIPEMGRTSTVTFVRAVGEKRITLSSEPGSFCPFLVNISADNTCSLCQQKWNFHILPLPADADILLGSVFSM